MKKNIRIFILALFVLMGLQVLSQSVFNHTSYGESNIINASLSDFSNLHPLVVHFPIVLLMLAFIAQIGTFICWKKQLNWIVFLLLIGGFASAYLASSLLHPHTIELSKAASQVLEKHDQYASYTLWISGISVLIKSLSLFVFKNNLWVEILLAGSLGFTAFTVSKTGHYGATLTHIHGVGIQGQSIETIEHNQNHKH